MRIAFVHGINNENNTPQSIEQTWWTALSDSWNALGMAQKPKPTISVAYYGDILAAGSQGNAVEMGPSPVSTGHAIELLKEYARAGGVTQQDLNAAADEAGISRKAVEQGFPHEGWIIDFAGLLEGILPSKGKFIARLFLRQAVVYINDIALAAKIDLKVRSQILDGQPDPTIVVAHSLGTVVAYRVLAAQAQQSRNVPLFVTLGSPLSVMIFAPILPPRGSLPKPPIAKWLNGRHQDDFVTLGRAITKASIGFGGVVDETKIVNPDDDKHSIVRYLASPQIARAIHAAL
jgi:hypothetical protein